MRGDLALQHDRFQVGGQLTPEEAARLAGRLVGLVQGTSALEGHGLTPDQLDALLTKAVRMILELESSDRETN